MNMIFQNYQKIFDLKTIEKEVEDCFPYEKFFAGQKEAIIQIVDSLINQGKKHVILEAPTGVGKTIIAYTAHRVLDKLLGSIRLKTTVTTTTKGLQAQYEKDTHTYDLKGKKNYMCPMGQEHYGTMGCKDLCSKKQCSPRRECPYVKRRLNWTENSYWRCTNTALFIEMCPLLCMRPENKADLVVFDECHKLPNTLLDHMEVEFEPEQLSPVNVFYGRVSDIYTLGCEIHKEVNDRFKNKVGQLVTFPDSLLPKVADLNERLNAFLELINEKMAEESVSDTIKEVCWRVIERCQDWSDTCEILTDCGVAEFVVQHADDKKVSLKPVYPAHVSEYGLFRKADYFIHMSATICGLDAYAKLIGIKDGEYSKISMAHPVDVERRMVNFMPVAKMSGNAGENELAKVVTAINDLCQMHPGQNGLIHTASYKLAESIRDRSPLKRFMFIGRDRNQTMEILKMNAKNKTQVIVLSPSMEEGYDLSHDLCRWQAIAKVPFGYLGDPLVKYLSDKNPSAYVRETVLRVVQASGRVVRGVDDFGVTYILDSSFGGLLSRGDEFFPGWYQEALREF